MARTVVVDFDIDGGRRLIEALDAAGFIVESALWFLNLESEEWRLVISSPVVDKLGPLKAYQTIRPVLTGLPGVGFRLDNIAAVGTKNPLVKGLRSTWHTEPGLRPLRISRTTTTTGVPIEDAYIYRLGPGPKPRKAPRAQLPPG